MQEELNEIRTIYKLNVLSFSRCELYRLIAKQPVISSYSIASRRNFYVSPLKDSPFKPPLSPSQMTPRSLQLYSFGDISGVGQYKKFQ